MPSLFCIFAIFTFFADLFFLLYRPVKREQIVDQVNSLTTRIMRDKKVVENSSVGRDDRAAAAVALFSRRSSDGEREESGAQPTMAFWQQVPRRAASKTPWTATARNERRVCAEGRKEGRKGQRPATAVIWLRACKRTKDNEVERAILTSRLNLCFLSSFLSVQYEKWMVYDGRLEG